MSFFSFFDAKPDPETLKASRNQSGSLLQALDTATAEPDKGRQLLAFDDLKGIVKATAEMLNTQRKTEAKAANRQGWGLVAVGTAIGYGLGILGGLALAAALAVPATGVSVVGAAGAAVFATATLAMSGTINRAARERFENGHTELDQTLIAVSNATVSGRAVLLLNSVSDIGVSPVAEEVFKRFPSLKAQFGKLATPPQPAEPKHRVNDFEQPRQSIVTNRPVG